MSMNIHTLTCYKCGAPIQVMCNEDYQKRVASALKEGIELLTEMRNKNDNPEVWDAVQQSIELITGIHDELTTHEKQKPSK